MKKYSITDSIQKNMQYFNHMYFKYLVKNNEMKQNEISNEMSLKKPNIVAECKKF